MIIRDDSAAGDDQEFGIPIEELQKCVAEVIAAHNLAPDPEMGGLSPEQVSALIYSDWDEPDCPIEFRGDLSPGELQASPFFIRARTFLEAVHATGGVKATAKKNLTRKFVEQMLDTIIDPETRAKIHKVSKVVNEEDLGALHIARVVCEAAGMLRLRKGVFAVPRNKVQLLTEERAGELFRLLFVTYFRRFNLAYANPYGPEAKALQDCVAYTIYRLGVVAQDWYMVKNLPGDLLLPAVRDAVDAEITQPYWSVEETLEWRIITPLIEWGLVEGRYTPHGKLASLLNLESIRVTELYDRFFRIRDGWSEHRANVGE